MVRKLGIQYAGVDPFMKNQLLLLALFIISSCVIVFADDTNNIEWGLTTNDSRMSISFINGESVIRTNQPFSVTVRIQNLSTNQTLYVYLPMGRVDPGFMWVVTSPDGNDASPPVTTRGSGAIDAIDPGGIFEFEFSLSSVCRFNQIGTYKITAKMGLGGLSNKVSRAVSNPLALTVVPGAWVQKTNEPILQF
jgi:hypothetical protein